MICKCDISDHVQTQVPHVSFAMVSSLLLVWLPAGFGWNIYLCTVICLLSLLGFVYFCGGRPEDYPSPTPAARLWARICRIYRRAPQLTNSEVGGAFAETVNPLLVSAPPRHGLDTDASAK